MVVSGLGCGPAAGIMVTASHNPRQDDGFKVYWNNGSQIIPPHDAGIAAAIDANLRPWQQYDTEGVPTHARAEDVTDRIAAAYFQAIKALSTSAAGLNAASSVKAVYTGKMQHCNSCRDYLGG